MYSTRLQSLRTELSSLDLDGFLVPMADEFQSEYVPSSARRIAFLSGFTGSAGFVVVLQDKAGFFTDSRYTLQAERQVDDSLFARFDSARLTPMSWIKAECQGPSKIGFDPWLHSLTAIASFEKVLKDTEISLCPVSRNPVDAVWSDRPASPAAPIMAYEIAYSGETSDDKRARVSAELQKTCLDAFVLTDPASIAWLLNIRGGDVPHTPLPLSYAILFKDGRVNWYVAAEKVTKGLDTVLGNDVARHQISDFPKDLATLASSRAKVALDPVQTPFAIVTLLRAASSSFVPFVNPCLLPKACKNKTEIDGMRAAHRRDGAALVKLMAWLEASPSPVTELQIEEKLEACRAANALYRGPSFDTIAGAGPHGAIVHYRATPETDCAFQDNALLLLDSGGQYLDGTTDVTRTLLRGAPSPEMKDRYTRVLKGHIALATLRFPEGTTGAEIDVLARQYLWAAGLDYGHGTGHGVGSYLGVHEGPQSISRRGKEPLRLGMVLSNEPGYYKTEAFGIRIENLLLVVELSDFNSGGRKTLGFETLTLAPYETRLIDLSLLTEAEKDWINAYHDRVRNTLRPQLDSASGAALDAATVKI